MEIEINPLLVLSNGAVAADALIPKGHQMTDTPDKNPSRGRNLGGHAGSPQSQCHRSGYQPDHGRDLFASIGDGDSLRVAIMRAEGDKFFLPRVGSESRGRRRCCRRRYGVGGFGGLQELPGLNKPVIAAVNGICCGGGLELALSCDLIIASDNASFALPEIRSGTVADAASVKLPKRIPYHVAMDLLLTGRWFDAEEALRWGLLRESFHRQSIGHGLDLARLWKAAHLW